MNYEKIYAQLINKRQHVDILVKTGDRNIESHHILPTCLNGKNDQTNIVNLTQREHYFAHLLLVKIHFNNLNARIKLFMALERMTGIKNNGHQNRTNIPSKLYQQLKSKSVKIKHYQISITNGKENKRILITDKIPFGWKRGETHKKSIDTCGKNTIWVNNGKINLRIKNNELIPSGFKLGLKKKKVYRRKTSFITFDGRTHTLQEWAALYNINQCTLRTRITKYNMSFEQALTLNVQSTPFKKLF